jgi:hypothetical protein
MAGVTTAGTMDGITAGAMAGMARGVAAGGNGVILGWLLAVRSPVLAEPQSMARSG